MPALASVKPSSLENLTRCEVFCKRPLTRVSSRGHLEEVDCVDGGAGRPDFPIDLLPGECALYHSLLAKGELILLTNFRLFVTVQPRKGFYNLPLLCIDAVECRDMFFLNVVSKDGRTAKICFENNESCLAWFKIITNATSPPHKLEDVFAFAFYAWCTDEKAAGRHGLRINVDSLQTEEQLDMQRIMGAEFRRLGYCPSLWRLTDLNKKFEFCSSYPVCWIVPASTSDADIESCGRYRSLRRVPAVVWRNRANGAVLVRSSQPEPGFFGWRSLADENLLHSILTAASTPGQQGCEKVPADADKSLLILDARSYTVAWANRAKGGGFESCENYKRCEIDFLGLANIHSIRYSFQKFRLAIVESTDSTWFQNLENCQWLHHIRALLNASLRVVEALHNDGRSVLVHCSDGWDRTTQIVSLAKLLLDPYYRTMKGFKELVEMDWIAFGHKFAERLGMQNGDLNQRAPVFLQWLDCVHYIMRDYPCSFEFNEIFLVKLAQHAYSGLFGTFLCNSLAERQKMNVLRRTFSVWDYLNADNEQFRNVLFVSENAVLFSCLRLQDMLSLWRNVYCPLEDSCRWKSESMTNSVCDGGELNTLTRAHSCDSLTSTPALASLTVSVSGEGSVATPHRTGSDSNLRIHHRKSNDDALTCKTASNGLCADADIADLMQCMLSEVEGLDIEQACSSGARTTTSMCFAAAFCQNFQDGNDTASERKCFNCDVLVEETRSGDSVSHGIITSSSASVAKENNNPGTACLAPNGTAQSWQQGRKLALTELVDMDGLVKVKDCAQQRIQDIILSYEKRIAHLQAKLSRVQHVILTHQCVPVCVETSASASSCEETKVVNDAAVEPSSYESKTSRSDVSWDAVEEMDGVPTRWIPDHATRRCMGCDSEFWMINRRHHCRSCGKIFCGNCSSYECPVPEEQFYEPVRVCNSCFSTLRFQNKVQA